MEQEELYIGLMSGTSADAIDAVLISLAPSNIQLISTHSQPLSPELRKEIHELAAPGSNEIQRQGELDRQLGAAFAGTTLELLNKASIETEYIKAIGSHGQTIRHAPPSGHQDKETAFTLQIADPNTIASLTGITTVADFRRRDIAEGGQGAPLVPAFHRALFQSPNENRAIVNIGGMGNITLLPSLDNNSPTPIIGFDTGPGNVLMDIWSLEKTGNAYDKNGDWGRSGSTIEKLLDQCLLDPYFQIAPPKSTGREYFNFDWLRAQLDTSSSQEAPPQNIQATLAYLTAKTIADAILQQQPDTESIYLCGGGAHNAYIIDLLQLLMPGQHISSTASIGLDPQWVEAAAFAWLAQQTMKGLPGNAPTVTGAKRECILGGIYLP